MPLVIEGLNSQLLKQKIAWPLASFGLAIMADDGVGIYLSSPAGEKGKALGSHSSLTSYKILNLIDIPVYDNYTYFIANIYNGSSYCGINVKNADNQKCFQFVSGSGWGGWGRPTASWANVGCWAIANIGNNNAVNWLIKIPMI